MKKTIILNLMNKEGLVNDLIEDLNMLDDVVEIKNFLLDHENELKELRDTVVNCLGQVSGATWRNLQQVGAFYGDIREYYNSAMKITNQDLDFSKLKDLILSMLYAYIFSILDYLPREENETSEKYEINEDKEVVLVIEDFVVPEDVVELMNEDSFKDTLNELVKMWEESPFNLEDLDYFRVNNIFFKDSDIGSDEGDDDALEFDDNNDLFDGLQSIMDLVEREDD